MKTVPICVCFLMQLRIFSNVYTPRDSLQCLFISSPVSVNWAVCSFLCVCVLSYVHLFMASGTVACQAPPPNGIFQARHWSWLPFPTPDLPDPGIKPESLASPAWAGRFFTTPPPGKPFIIVLIDFQKSSIYYGKAYLNKQKEVCVYTLVYLTSSQVFF